MSTWIIRIVFLIGLAALAYPAWLILRNYTGESQEAARMTDAKKEELNFYTSINNLFSIRSICISLPTFLSFLLSIIKLEYPCNRDQIEIAVII